MIKGLDIFLMGFYLIFLIFIGFVSGRKNESSDDFFVANRQMGYIPVALSIAATTISSNGFIGGPGWAYANGINPFMINIAVPLACFFSLVFATPIMYHLKVISIYEYIRLRFGIKTKLLLVLHFFINSIIQVSSMIFIPSLFLSILTGWPLKLVIPIIVICSIIYTSFGGIKAVMWSDVFQMIIVWGSMILVIYIAFNSLDFSFGELFSKAQSSGRLNALDFDLSFKKNTTFFGTLLGGSILWTRYFAFDQTQTQRILTSNSIKTVKQSLLISSVIMNLVYFFLLLIGILLYFFFNKRSFNNLNYIMIEFILNKIPTGFLGLVLSGILASVMSSVDSILNSMTTIFIKDIYEPYLKKNKSLSTPKYVPVVTSLIFGVLIVIFVIIGFENSIKSVLEVVGSYISYLVGPACAIFMMGIFHEKINDKGASFGMIFGLVAGFFVSKSLDAGWIWNPFIGFSLSYIGSFSYNTFFPHENYKSQKYTLKAIKKEIEDSNITEEKNVSLIPGHIDKYAMITLIFFFSQYALLFLIK